MEYASLVYLGETAWQESDIECIADAEALRAGGKMIGGEPPIRSRAR